MRFDGIDPFSLRGKELLKFRRRVQMVFQDPYASLNARMSAGDIIAEPWRSHKGMYKNKRERDMRVRGLLDLVGLGAKAADKYPQEFSGGQRQRIGIARALALDPDVIICDEPVSALDLSVQAQVLNLLNDLQQQLQISYVFISHDLSVVRHVADRVAVMYLGRIIESGPTEAVFDRPNHPYTAALMSAAPTLDGAQRRERILLKGEVPSPLEPAVGVPVPDPLLEGHRDLRDDRAAATRSTSRSSATAPSATIPCSGGGGVLGDGMSVAGVLHRGGRGPAGVGAAGVDRVRHRDARRADRRARRPRADSRDADHGRDGRHADGGDPRTRGHRPARAPAGRWSAGCPAPSRGRCCWRCCRSGRWRILLAGVVLVGVVLTSFGWIPAAAAAQRRARRRRVGRARHRHVDRRSADGAGVATQ